MLYLNDIKDMVMYKSKFYLPIDEKDKTHNSLVYLLTPNIDTSINTINSPLFINKYHKSYYIEKNISIFINKDGSIENKEGPLNESVEEGMGHKRFMMKFDKFLDNSPLQYSIQEQDDRYLVDVLGEPDILTEDANSDLKKILYAERLKTPKEVLAIHDRIKENCEGIKLTHLYLEKYAKKNLFLDFFYYIESFYKNNTFTSNKSLDLYLEFLSRFIKDNRTSSYSHKCVLVPVNEWIKTLGDESTVYTKSINPISMLNRLMKINPQKVVDTFGDIDFVFMGTRAWFKINFSKLEFKSIPRFLGFINKLTNVDFVPEDEESEAKVSARALADEVISSIEKGANVNINDISGKGKDLKDDIVKKVKDAAQDSDSVEDLVDELDKDDKFKDLLLQLYSSETGAFKINDARNKRLQTLNAEILEKELDGVKIKDIIGNTISTQEELPSTKLEIESANEEWEDMKYINFESSYDVKADIVSSLLSFQNKSYPVSIRDMSIDNTSTTEDYVDTYTVNMEDGFGKRFNVVFDVPKFKDHKFMLLKGNEKTLSGQLLLIPIIKTDVDTVQIVSNYNKIFIRRFGNKISNVSERIVKALKKIKSDKYTISFRDCHTSNLEFNIDYEYLGLSERVSKIDTGDYIIYMNQKEIRDTYNIEDAEYTPIGYDKVNKSVIYNTSTELSDVESIRDYLCMDDDFKRLFNLATVSNAYMYSNASILNSKIPLICLLSYNIGLTNALERAGVKYEITEKKPKAYNKDTDGIVRFSDGYLRYTCMDSSQRLLMGGLQAKTDYTEYSISQLNDKAMWTDILDCFGNRTKLSDGLDNFMDLMIDPITEEVLKDYKLPTEYIDVLLYANSLLTDNQYIADADLRGRRYRSNELVAGYIYKALAEAYADYKNQAKRGRKDATMSLKQSAAIDAILSAPTCSDASVLNALLDAEMINTTSWKGLSGMNSDRGFSVDKRAYDKSMINNLAMSTGFAGNVGISRQNTMDMNIKGKRGYIKITDDLDEMSVTKTLSTTEGLVPYGSTRDDPMRVAMGFIQMAKHQMRTKVSHPQLITNGTDMALPYMISNNFAFKSKHPGKVKKVTKDYMLLEYDNGDTDFVDLRNNIKKNSSGGFFLSLKLDACLKEGDTFTQNTVVAYDYLSFNDNMGMSDNISYNAGILAKCVAINADDGYEDSCIVSEWMSEAATSSVVVKKEIYLPKDSELLQIIKKGDPIEEGDSILTYQSAYDQEDVNMLLRILNNNQEEVNEVGKVPIKSKVTGFVEDIKIYRTVEIEDLSPSLQNLINDYEVPIKKIRKVMSSNNVDWVNTIEPDYALPATGKLKGAPDGVYIELYLRFDDKFSVGDKITFYNALKGVCRTIFPKGKEPRSSFRPEERCDTIISLGSINGRMTGAVITNGFINKNMIELTRKCKDILGIEWNYLNHDK